MKKGMEGVGGLATSWGTKKNKKRGWRTGADEKKKERWTGDCRRGVARGKTKKKERQRKMGKVRRVCRTCLD